MDTNNNDESFFDDIQDLENIPEDQKESARLTFDNLWEALSIANDYEHLNQDKVNTITSMIQRSALEDTNVPHIKVDNLNAKNEKMCIITSTVRVKTDRGYPISRVRDVFTMNQRQIAKFILEPFINNVYTMLDNIVFRDATHSLEFKRAAQSFKTSLLLVKESDYGPLTIFDMFESAYIDGIKTMGQDGTQHTFYFLFTTQLRPYDNGFILWTPSLYERYRDITNTITFSRTNGVELNRFNPYMALLVLANDNPVFSNSKFISAYKVRGVSPGAEALKIVRDYLRGDYTLLKKIDANAEIYNVVDELRKLTNAKATDRLFNINRDGVLSNDLINVVRELDLMYEHIFTNKSRLDLVISFGAPFIVMMIRDLAKYAPLSSQKMLLMKYLSDRFLLKVLKNDADPTKDGFGGQFLATQTLNKNVADDLYENMQKIITIGETVHNEENELTDQQNSILKTENRELRDQNNNLTNKVGDLEKERNRLRKVLNVSRQQIDDLEKNLHELENQKTTDIETQINQKNQQIKDLKDEMRKLIDDNERQKGYNEDYEKQMIQLDNQLKTLNQNRNELQNKYDEIFKEKNELDRINKTLEKEIDELKDQIKSDYDASEVIEELEQKNKELQSSEKLLETQIEYYKNSIKKLESDKFDIGEQNDYNKNEIDRLKKKIDTLQKELEEEMNEKENEIKTLNNKIVELQKLLEIEQNKVGKNQNQQYVKLKEQYDDLMKQKDEIVEELEDIKTQKDNLKDEKENLDERLQIQMNNNNKNLDDLKKEKEKNKQLQNQLNEKEKVQITLNNTSEALREEKKQLKQQLEQLQKEIEIKNQKIKSNEQSSDTLKMWNERTFDQLQEIYSYLDSDKNVNVQNIKPLIQYTDTIVKQGGSKEIPVIKELFTLMLRMLKYIDNSEKIKLNQDIINDAKLDNQDTKFLETKPDKTITEKINDVKVDKEILNNDDMISKYIQDKLDGKKPIVRTLYSVLEKENLNLYKVLNSQVYNKRGSYKLSIKREEELNSIVDTLYNICGDEGNVLKSEIKKSLFGSHAYDDSRVFLVFKGDETNFTTKKAVGYFSLKNPSTWEDYGDLAQLKFKKPGTNKYTSISFANPNDRNLQKKERDIKIDQNRSRFIEIEIICSKLSGLGRYMMNYIFTTLFKSTGVSSFSLNKDLFETYNGQKKLIKSALVKDDTNNDYEGVMLVLGGGKTNTRARTLYESFGFKYISDTKWDETGGSIKENDKTDIFLMYRDGSDLNHEQMEKIFTKSSVSFKQEQNDDYDNWDEWGESDEEKLDTSTYEKTTIKMSPIQSPINSPRFKSTSTSSSSKNYNDAILQISSDDEDEEDDFFSRHLTKSNQSRSNNSFNSSSTLLNNNNNNNNNNESFNQLFTTIGTKIFSNASVNQEISELNSIASTHTNNRNFKNMLLNLQTKTSSSFHPQKDMINSQLKNILNRITV